MGWERMFRELVFIARDDDDQDIALWKHSTEIPEERAPIVVLDSEGQLECRAATFADLLVTMMEDPGLVQSWCLAREIPVSPNAEIARAKVRLLPDANERAQAFQLGGDPPPLHVRDVPPQMIEDLPGMAGGDPRVSEFLEAIESKENPIEVLCDRQGRVRTLFLTPESVRVPIKVYGIPFGVSDFALAALGQPTKKGETWARWDDGDLAVHYEFPNRQVSRITIMLRSSLPPHLR
jgi:hypothetical protein